MEEEIILTDEDYNIDDDTDFIFSVGDTQDVYDEVEPIEEENNEEIKEEE